MSLGLLEDLKQIDVIACTKARASWRISVSTFEGGTMEAGHQMALAMAHPEPVDCHTFGCPGHFHQPHTLCSSLCRHVLLVRHLGCVHCCTSSDQSAARCAQGGPAGHQQPGTKGGIYYPLLTPFVDPDGN